MSPTAPLAFALGASAAALAAAALLLAGIAALRGLRRWRAWRLARHVPAWKEALAAGMRDPAAAPLPRIAPPELAAFLAAWNQAHAAVGGLAADNLETLLRLHQIDRRVLRLLHRPSPRLRLIAIATLAELRETRAWEPLLALSRRPGPVLSFAAARALMRIDARRALEALAPSICTRHDWPLTRLGTIFRELGSETVTRPLVSMLTSRPRTGLERAVHLARFGDRARLSPVVRDWLGTSSQPEVLVAALEYAEEPDDLPWARTLSRHGDWRVRAASALALARSGGRGELQLLLELLRDPVWRVRYRASQALIRLEGLTPMELDALRDSERDAFAADMLAQSLAEAGIR